MTDIAIIQSGLLRGHDFDLSRSEVKISVLYPGRRTQGLKEIEDSLTGSERVIMICSIETARIAKKSFPRIARGVWLDEEPLRASRMSGIIPGRILLNRTSVFMPLGAVPSRAEQMRAIFGDRVFMRPDSPMKHFSGLVCETSDLPFEASCAAQVNVLHGDHLVMIDRAREIMPVEYRFWLCDGEVVTWSPYAHDGGRADISRNDLASAMVAAQEVAAITETIVNPVVADFAIENGEAKLIEMNAFSTSGIYPGADVRAIIRAGMSVAA